MGTGGGYRGDGQQLFECYPREDSLNAKENSNGQRNKEDVRQTENKIKWQKIFNYVNNNIKCEWIKQSLKRQR